MTIRSRQALLSDGSASARLQRIHPEYHRVIALDLRDVVVSQQEVQARGRQVVAQRLQGHASVASRQDQFFYGKHSFAISLVVVRL